MTGAIQADGLPPEVQELLRRYMPNFVAENVIVLGGTDHMRLIFVGPPGADGQPVPRCSIDFGYGVAAGLAGSINGIITKRPS